jgi:cytochrome c
VVGRKAGAISAFPYSESAKKSCVVWSEAVLDKWLIDPETVIPDTDMARRGRTRLSETDGQIDAEDPHRS